MKRIGLLGGSFDPVHLAHLALAETARATLSLDEVQLIPAGQPWQRAALHTSAAQRQDMVELAIADRPGLTVNPVELHRQGATYTYDTVSTLPSGPEYFWLLGADQLANFCTWRRWQDIADCVTLVVANRPGTALVPPDALAEHLRQAGRALIEVPFQPLDISSSRVRAAYAEGRPIDALVPAAVAQYIARHGLYQQAV